MKLYLRILLLLSAMVLALSAFVGCEMAEKETPTVPEDDDIVDDFFPDVERKDYGEDFYILAPDGNGESNKDYYMDEDSNDGSPMDEAVYHRQSKVEKYLGIDIKNVYPVADGWDYQTYVQTAVQNMDGTIDTVMVDVHRGVTHLVAEKLLLDLSELEGIDLDAEYWNQAFMNELELNGNYFLGRSDFNIFSTFVVAFNKDMLEQYNSSMDKSLYDTVKDMEWTLDEMIELASLVYADTTGDGKSEDDTYGITGTGWLDVSGFLTSSDIPMLAQDSSGSYKVAINQAEHFARADELVEKLRTLCKSNCAYFDHKPMTGEIPSVSLTSGRVLMQLALTSNLTRYLSYDIEFGVLPFPMYDRDQASVGYKTLQWGGYIGVPSYIKNPIKVGETLEMLSFYSENVRITYYEKLLGKQVADMPDDVAMFDIIWDGLTTDVGQTYVNATGFGDRGLCYTIAELLQPSATQNLASFIGARENAANESFRKFMNGIK